MHASWRRQAPALQGSRSSDDAHRNILWIDDALLKCHCYFAANSDLILVSGQTAIVAGLLFGNRCPPAIPQELTMRDAKGGEATGRSGRAALNARLAAALGLTQLLRPFRCLVDLSGHHTRFQNDHSWALQRGCLSVTNGPPDPALSQV